MLKFTYSLSGYQQYVGEKLQRAPGSRWVTAQLSASTFKEISFFWRNLRNFERLKEFFKEFQKFKEFQGNLRKEKEIIQKFREFKEIWVKYKEIGSNSRKSKIPEALARIFNLSMSLLLKRAIIKEHKIEEKSNFSSARSHILIFYIKFMRQDFETYHY